HRSRIGARERIAVTQMNEVMNRDDEWHAKKRNDIVRRVEEIDLCAATNREQLSNRVFRCVDDDMLNAVRNRNAGRPERDIFFAAEINERMQQAANVRSDAEVADLAAVDADPHPRAAWPRSSVMSWALRSHGCAFARSIPRSRRSCRSGSSASRRTIPSRKALRSPRSIRIAAPSA